MTKPIQVKNMSLGEGIPKICVPITGKTEEEIKEEGKKSSGSRCRARGMESRFF